MMQKISSLELIEAKALRRQQTAFCVLTLFVIAVLLLLHTLFASLLGEPSEAVIVLLGIAFSAKVLEFFWLQGRVDGISEYTARWETALSIIGTFVLTCALAVLTDRDDAPYFVLLAIPILQSAYHFGWVTTVITIVVSIGTNFYWIGHYFGLHPPPRPTEFLETGMISVIYTLMGLLVWYLVHQLKHQQVRLHENFAELEATREKLVVEEKLAAVGRLASGIAHEIRNPVAMISSSLATAANLVVAPADREEMVQIAAKEARRLEHLTSDFLSYAGPRMPQRSLLLTNDLFSYVAEVVKAHAASRGVEVVHSFSTDIVLEIDPAQVQAALLNLALNGIDATNPSGTLSFYATQVEAFTELNVENTGHAIAETDLPQIFEPFYSTKPTGTGLGLAIARRVARDHGGDLRISCNQEGRVVFSMTVSTAPRGDSAKEL